MRLLLVVLAITQLLMPPMAQAQMLTRSSEITLAICTMARDDDTRKLQQKLMELRLRLRDIYAGIRCNQQSLIQFALSYQANNIAVYLASYVNVNDLVESGDIEWLRQRNLLDTPVGRIVRERVYN